MTDMSPDISPSAKRKWMWVLAGIFVTTMAVMIYVRSHPLVFNDSFFEHTHCIVQASGALSQYASDNFGRFPAHTNGYGDALLLLIPEYTPWSVLTGPGYNAHADEKWKLSSANVPEVECGRVYVQGLTETNNPEIAILFDKLPSPGGDHCHLLTRFTAPLCREVLFLDGSHRTIRESNWPEFAENQIALLVKEGFDRTAAKAIYAEKGKGL